MCDCTCIYMPRDKFRSNTVPPDSLSATTTMHDCCDRSGSLEYTYESAVIPSMQTSMLLIGHKLSYCTEHACAHPDRLIVLRCVYARLRYARTLVFVNNAWARTAHCLQSLSPNSRSIGAARSLCSIVYMARVSNRSARRSSPIGST